MAWTTSAHPWASILASGAVARAATCHTALLKLAAAAKAATWVKLLAASHLACLAVFANLDGFNLILLTSGAALLLALVMLPAQRQLAAPLVPPTSPGVETERDRPARPKIEPAEIDAATWAELMARMSHELRTPLNAIIGFSDLMGGELFGPMGHPRYREYVDHIRDSGRDLLRSAEDTLAITTLLARPSTAQAQQSSTLATLISEAWLPHSAEAADRAVHLSIEGQLRAEVLGDRRALRQIIGNLLAESLARARAASEIAISATVDGGTVKLCLRVSSDRARHFSQSSSLPACLARIMIELNGSSLVETFEADGTWLATTWLDAAAQQELFLS